MKDVFKAAENRILAKRVKAKFTPPAEEVRKVRVLSSGVASVAGQVYNAEAGGYRPGDIVEAVNIGTKGNAHYVARYGGNGLTEADVERMIKKALKDFARVPDFVQPPITAPSDIIRASITPIVNTTNTFDFTIPPETVEGDLIYGFLVTNGILQDRISYGGDYGLYIITDQIADTQQALDPYTGAIIELIVFEAVATAGSAGTTITFNFETAGSTGDPIGDQIFALYVLNKDALYSLYYTGTAITGYGASNRGYGIHGNDAVTNYPDNTDYYKYYDFSTSTIHSGFTGNSAETGGCEILNANEFVFSVCASFNTASVTPNTGETELLDISSSTNSLFIGWKLYETPTSYTGNRIFTQSPERYSVTTLFGVESY